jgi:hypothetical protein
MTTKDAPEAHNAPKLTMTYTCFNGDEFTVVGRLCGHLYKDESRNVDSMEIGEMTRELAVIVSLHKGNQPGVVAVPSEFMGKLRKTIREKYMYTDKARLDGADDDSD